MVKYTKLSTKLIARFLGVFLCVAIALGGIIQVVAAVSTNRYVDENYFSSHAETDKGVALLLDETVYLYAAIVSSDNAPIIAELADPALPFAARQAKFDGLIASMPVLTEYFANVVLANDIGIYAYAQGLDMPAGAFISAVKNEGRELTVGGVSGGYLQLGKVLRGISGEAEGVLVFYIHEKALTALALTAEEDGGVLYSFIADDRGLVITHSIAGAAGKTFILSQYFGGKIPPFYGGVKIDGKRRLVVATVAEEVLQRYGLKLTIISVLSSDIIYQNSGRAMIISGALMIPALAVGIFVCVRRGKKLAGPVNELNDDIHEFMNSPKKGAITPRGDELDQLSQSYDKMTGQILTLMEKQRLDLETQRKLELDALQIQINPHILYNTLDAIAWMAKIKKQEDIEKLAIGLAKFFRTSLHKGEKFVTVREEFEIVKSFIAIDRIRFPDKFDVTYDIEDGMEDYSTLKLILQPIVENAIKHGIAPLEGRGNLKISARVDGGDIIFVVEDDGVGLDVEELRKKNEGAAGGYGLKNVNERIRLEYGDGYGVTVRSEPKKGATATVRIAKRN